MVDEHQSAVIGVGHVEVVGAVEEPDQGSRLLARVLALPCPVSLCSGLRPEHCEMGVELVLNAPQHVLGDEGVISGDVDDDVTLAWNLRTPVGATRVKDVGGDGLQVDGSLAFRYTQLGVAGGREADGY